MFLTLYKSTMAAMGNEQAMSTVNICVNMAIVLWEYVTVWRWSA
jgi:hypothetical protein